MLMADTIAIFLVVIGLMLSFIGLWLLCRGLWPQTVTLTAGFCSVGLVKCFFMGIPITAIMILLAGSLLGNAGAPGKILGFVVISFYILYSHCGVAGLVTVLGERLGDYNEDSPWKVTLRGGVVLVLTYLPPILGWFIILPISTIVGCGARTQMMFHKKPAATEEKFSSGIPSQEQKNSVAIMEELS